MRYRARPTSLRVEHDRSPGLPVPVEEGPVLANVRRQPQRDEVRERIAQKARSGVDAPPMRGVPPPRSTRILPSHRSKWTRTGVVTSSSAAACAAVRSRIAVRGSGSAAPEAFRVGENSIHHDAERGAPGRGQRAERV